ncbi:transcription factor IBH1 [Manihot esculenta]|uniref:IBH1-like N-terminal domain-containing protein n=1 Tax=Manihot esculenta TaxID=3983 RepID=A0A2C9V0F6_MANES|nr:transcription factor IBH1 [Manihot esculenta]OAY37602.1 hypothetical protein MANES_11G114000v8 [Manihot esculenta]
MNSIHYNSTTRTKFARRFLISLSRIRRATTLGPPSDEEIRRRTHRIKLAAYSSMARAVGSRRAWSRALLLKIRNRALVHGILRNRFLASKKKRVIKRNKVSTEMNKVDMLRKLVPGGETMDVCELLEETAHFMASLATQVKVMKSIVDHCSE